MLRLGINEAVLPLPLHAIMTCAGELLLLYLTFAIRELMMAI
jgi:hypothetical protein